MVRISGGAQGILAFNTLVTTLVLLGAALLVLPVIWQTLGKMMARSRLRPR